MTHATEQAPPKPYYKFPQASALSSTRQPHVALGKKAFLVNVVSVEKEFSMSDLFSMRDVLPANTGSDEVLKSLSVISQTANQQLQTTKALPAPIDFSRLFVVPQESSDDSDLEQTDEPPPRFQLPSGMNGVFAGPLACPIKIRK